MPKPESIEMQIGRSDFKLGEFRNPFPKNGEDAKNWKRGWIAEKQIEIDIQAQNTPLPRKKRWS